jgi:arginine-tRNA-protein transferase
VDQYDFSRSERRILSRSRDLRACLVEAEATHEQFDLLRRYLETRHAQGGMADMAWPDYVAMVEDTAVRTHLMEYRLEDGDRGPGQLVACALVDQLSDGLSLVYSFFDPDLSRRSPGSFIILDHILQARRLGLPFLYLGYWVSGSEKMDYKQRFSPLETLEPSGWTLLQTTLQRAKTAP